VNVDTADVGVLARFHSELRGWPIWELCIQRNPDYVRPVGPAGPGEQQDAAPGVRGDRPGSETARAVELGAELPAHRPQDDVRVLLDPAGHPSCLYT
jgi:hypothetical protein